MRDDLARAMWADGHSSAKMLGIVMIVTTVALVLCGAAACVGPFLVGG